MLNISHDVISLWPPLSFQSELSDFLIYQQVRRSLTPSIEVHKNNVHLNHPFPITVNAFFWYSLAIWFEIMFILFGGSMNIQIGVALKKIARSARGTRNNPRRNVAKSSSGVIGKTFKLMGKVGINLTQLASLVLIGKLWGWLMSEVCEQTLSASQLKVDSIQLVELINKSSDSFLSKSNWSVYWASSWIRYVSRRCFKYLYL